MSGGSAPNPYGANNPEYAGQQSNTADYGVPNNAYSAPSASQDAPYNDEFGWGPKLRMGTATPDAMREQSMPQRWFYPQGSEEEPGPFYESRDKDDAARHRNETQDADGWTELKNRKAVGRNARETPPPETRPTERMAPRSYSFTRPFDQFNRNYADVQIGSSRHLNAMHFSMADHRRDYPILGMKPNHNRRNTYRLDPAPWDADVVDMPPPVEPNVTPARLQSVDVIRAAEYGRAFRLG